VLLDHKRKRQSEVEGRVREGRAPRTREVGDMLDSSDADVQSSLDFSLLQMNAAMLTRIDEALARLDMGRYGTCIECGEDIAERRLRALPFAVRCHECESGREAEDGRGRVDGVQRGRSTLFPDSVGT
jgi:DnaK suppressor protein